MTSEFLLDQAGKVFPAGKELQPAQLAAYHEKLWRFSDHQRQGIYDWVLENCKFFPKIADIYAGAMQLGYLAERHDYKPHLWEETDCGRCIGSGLMAAFWSQDFGKGEETKGQTLTLKQIMPYHRSATFLNQNGGMVRSVFRCSCAAGLVTTLDKGIPRFNGDRPLVIERSWG